MLRALCEYYDLLRGRSGSDLPPDGYSVVGNVGWNLVLQEDGTIADILPYTQEVIVGKKIKTVGKSELFPFRNSVSGIAAETIDHREKYLFGMEWDKGSQTLVAGKRAVEAFEKCREVNLAFLEGISDPLAAAYCAFLRRWQPERETQNPFLAAMGKAYQGAKFVITLRGAEALPLNRLPSVCEKWERSLLASAEEDPVVGQCAVSGQVGPLARLHDSIAGIKGGLATGTSLVCFNNTAFVSYGREQSYNSSISVESMKKYTKALNYLASSPKHKQILDDMTILFWANAAGEEEPYLDVFSFAMFPSEEALSDEDLKAVFVRLAEGRTSDLAGIDLSTPFYVLGIKPNSSRLAVKIFERNSFGKMMRNVAKHCRNMSFSPEDKQIPLWAIDRALRSPLKKKEEEVDPALQAKLLLAVIKGTPYPQSMLTTAVRRCKIDHDDAQKKFYAVSSTRARIIKACLERKNIISEGEYNMLQENSTNTAYNLGRLFAALEKIQTEALGDINATIKDKYFASACATPYLVFPRLLKLAQPHLAKLDEGNRIYKDKLLQEILSKVGDFPKACDMQQQGMFILGYYQQKQKFYEKKEKGENER